MKAPWFPFYKEHFTPEMLSPNWKCLAKHRAGTGPRIDIDAKAFLAWVVLNNLEPADVGCVIKAICAAATKKDWPFILAYPWVSRRIYVGTAPRPSISASVRARVLAVGKCAYCGATDNLTVDHIIPYSKGGAHDETNFQCLCWPCNRAKSDKMEVENG